MELTWFVRCLFLLILSISAGAPAPTCDCKNTLPLKSSEQSCLLNQLLHIITHLVNCTPKVTPESYQKLLESTNCSTQTEPPKQPEVTFFTLPPAPFILETPTTEKVEEPPPFITENVEKPTEPPATEIVEEPAPTTEKIIETTMAPETTEGTTEQEDEPFLPFTFPITIYPYPPEQTTDPIQEETTTEYTIPETNPENSEPLIIVTLPPPLAIYTNPEIETPAVTEPVTVEVTDEPYTAVTEPVTVEVTEKSFALFTPEITVPLQIIPETSTQSRTSIDPVPEVTTSVVEIPAPTETCKEDHGKSGSSIEGHEPVFKAETFFIPVLKFHGANCMSADELRDYLFNYLSCPKSQKHKSDC